MCRPGPEQLARRPLGVSRCRPDALVHVLDLRMNGDEPYPQLVLYCNAEENAVHFDRGRVPHRDPWLIQLPWDCRRKTV